MNSHGEAELMDRLPGTCVCVCVCVCVCACSRRPILTNDEYSLVLGEPYDSAVCLEASSGIEHSCVHHLTRLHGHIVTTQLLHNFLCL